MKVTMFIAVAKTATIARKIKENTNGVIPLILDPVQGVSPRGVNILDGTVAKNDKVKDGNCYAFKAVELEPGDKGFDPDYDNRQFNISRMSKPMKNKEMIKYAMMNDITVIVDPENDAWDTKSAAKADAKALKKAEKKARKAAAQVILVEEQVIDEELVA